MEIRVILVRFAMQTPVSWSQNQGGAEPGGNLGKVSRIAQFPEHSPWSHISGRPGGGVTHSLHTKYLWCQAHFFVHETSTTFLHERKVYKFYLQDFKKHKSIMVNILFNYLIRITVFYTDTFMSSHSLFLRGRWDSSFFPWKAPGFVKVLRKVPRSWKKNPRIY